MPIDYLSRMRTGQKGLSDVIGGRNIDDEIGRMGTSVAGRRSALLGKLGGMTPGIEQSIAAKTPMAMRKSTALLAQKKAELSRKKYISTYENLLEEAVQAGMDVRSATTYARQLSSQAAQQSFEAGEANKSREFSKKMSSLSDYYADRGLALDSQFADEGPDWQSALLSGVIGTGTALGSSYFLTKNYLNSLNVPQNNVKAPEKLNMFGSTRDYFSRR